MPITPSPFTTPVADTDTPFNKTLALAGTEEQLVAVPGGKKGRIISLVNDGPGTVGIAFDQAATVASLNIKAGEGYSEAALQVNTDVRFINVTAAQTPTVRGVLWSGN